MLLYVLLKWSAHPYSQENQSALIRHEGSGGTHWHERNALTWHELNEITPLHKLGELLSHGTSIVMCSHMARAKWVSALGLVCTIYKMWAFTDKKTLVHSFLWSSFYTASIFYSFWKMFERESNFHLCSVYLKLITANTTVACFRETQMYWANVSTL